MHAKTQVPLPEVIARDLPYETIDFLNDRDYFLAHNVSHLLDEELALAKKQLNTYENPLFPGSESPELPITTHTENGVGISSTQGLRNAQEDTHIIFNINKLKISCLFDGHLGPKCSEYSQKYYQECFEKRFSDPELKPLPEEDFLYNVLTLSLVILGLGFITPRKW